MTCTTPQGRSGGDALEQHPVTTPGIEVDRRPGRRCRTRNRLLLLAGPSIPLAEAIRCGVTPTMLLGVSSAAGHGPGFEE